MSINQGERLKLFAWSDNKNDNETLASYTVYPNGLVYIDPDPKQYNYFKGLGLKTKGRFFEVDMNNHPVGTVAKAFGLNYDDSAVRHQINTLTDGQVSGARLMALAIEGIPGQMGSLQSMDQGSHKLRAINASALVTEDDKINLDTLYSDNKHESQGMEFREILINEGHSIRHGYAICLTDPEEGNDRLAIYAASMKSMEGKDGVHADKVFGIKLTKEGKPILICYDATRPKIEVRAIIATDNMIGRLLKVRRSEFDSRKPVSPGISSVRLANTSTFNHYVEAKAIKNLMQRTSGYLVNDPLVSGSEVFTGRAVIPVAMDVHALMNFAKKDYRQAEMMAQREIKIAGKDPSGSSALTRKVEQAIGNVASHSRLYLQEIDTMIENDKMEKSMAAEPKQRSRREYTLADLDM